MKDQIRKLYLAGYSLRGISKALKLSRNTVRKYLRTGCEQAESKKASQPSWAEALDWKMIAQKRQQGVSIKQLHSAYAPDHVPYSTFGDRLRKHLKPLKIPSLHLVHNPAEKTQIDYCDGIYLVDPKSGKKIKTHMFCGVLPFSSYTFAEFVLDQKLASFIRSHQKMWSYFGGVTPYALCCRR
jgi:transposase